MSDDQNISGEIESTLRRYIQIQQEERRLQEEKASLQENIAAHMAGRGKEYWYPTVDNQSLKVRCIENTIVEYDEEVLRRRLGARYASILAPDPKKIRRNMDKINEAFAPVIDLVGSPTPDKVRSAVDSGVVTKEEFSGAFKKTTKRIVSVSKARTDTPVPVAVE